MIRMATVLMLSLFSLSVFSDDLKELIAVRQQLMSGKGVGSLMASGETPIPQSYSKDYTVETTGFDLQVDPDAYILGAGDGFTITLFGTVNKVMNTTIDLEGNAIIPSVGVVSLKGKTLKEGKKLVEEKIFEVMKKVELSISLTEIRRFKVYLLGDVPQPSDNIANGATRVSDIIVQDNKTPPNHIMRSIELVNDLFPKRIVDLSVFFHSNDITFNPYLLEGDRIFIKKMTRHFNVNGAVNYPGTYALVDNDSLGLIAQVFGGFARGADSTAVLIKRFKDDLDSLESIVLSFQDPATRSFKIMPDDRIFVRNIPEYRVARNISITGEVRYPGTYPIQKDKTKLAQIIEAAGGLTADAFLRGSRMVRNSDTHVGDKEFERLSKLPPASLSPAEKSYLKTRLTEEGNIVNINFEELMYKETDYYNIVLRDGDEIHIAHKNLSIKVMGAVLTPGLIEFKSEESIGYYIERAGGFSSTARKNSIKVMKAGSEYWLKPRDVHYLEPGDAIWIQDKGYTNGYVIAKEIIMVLGAAAALFISALTINDLVTRDDTASKE